MQRGLRTLTLAVGAILALGAATDAQQPQYQYSTAYQLNKWYYYPYTYFPHNYWPAQGPRWPEPQGAPYMRPPAYMAYPPFREPNWRYDLWEPARFYRGFHYWLDQF